MDRPDKPLAHTVTERLEHWTALDGPARAIATIVQSLASPGTPGDLLTGRWLGHALHPLLTDVPIGTWTSSLILDMLGGSSAEGAADLLLGVGIAAVAPTALAGWADWSETSTEQRRVGLVHAAANIAAAGMFSVSYARRRQGRRGSAKLFSIAGAGALSVGGYLGGHLSYARGAGVGER